MPFTRACVSCLLLCSLLVSGCTTTSPVPADAGGEANSETVAPFPIDTLESLLIAEFAGMRQQPDLSVQHYSEQAQRTRDLEIVRRATLIAQHFNREEDVLTNAELWHSLDPQANEPMAVLATLTLKQGKLLQSFDYTLALLEKGFDPPFESIAAQAVRYGKEDRAALMARFDAALAKHNRQHSLLLGKALLYFQEGRHDESLDLAYQAIDARPANAAACILAATLLEQAQRQKDAARILARRMQEEPYDQRVHLHYARLLSTYDLQAAQKEFKALVDRNPYDGQLMLALALVSHEAGDMPMAREYFEQLLFIQQHETTAHYYLGEIAEKNGDNTRALEYYRRVTDGNEYFYAVAAYCRLSIRDGDLTRCLLYLDSERKRRPDAAIKLHVYEASVLLEQKQYSNGIAMLTRALETYRDDIDLVYSRSLLFEMQGDLAAAEKDLRSILNRQPDHANSLNALGYLLANRTDRLDEAHQLITRALALEPDSAAITDSMGWLLYKQGRPAEALPYLEKAMQLMPNHEIAAHLGEVLWVLGKHKQARAIWKRGIEDDPDSDILKETLRRLQVP